MSEIKAVVSDLDGTLVDTFEANFLAYRSVFAARGFTLSRDMYRKVFGLRIDELLKGLGMSADAGLVADIRRSKAQCYPNFFEALRPNQVLIAFLRAFRAQGGRTALASTASRANVENVMRHIGVSELFDFVIAGEDVKNGKPHPECYNVACARLRVDPDEVLVFEDTAIGIEAARRAGMKAVKIGEAFYGA